MLLLTKGIKAERNSRSFGDVSNKASTATLNETSAATPARSQRGGSRLVSLKVSDFYVAFALFTLMFLLGRQIAVPGVAGTFHDDGVYLSTAKSLAEGTGYRLIAFPGEPWQTKYPILYPLLLSAIWRVCPAFPANVELMQCFTILCSSLFLSLTYLFLVRFSYFPRPVSLFAVLLCSSVPGFVFFSGQLLSEMPFALALLIAMWHLEEHVEQSRSTKLSSVMLGISLSMPFLIRLIGLATPLAALVYLMRRGRPFKLTGITIATIAAIGIGLQAQVGSTDPGIRTDEVRAYQTNYVDWWQRQALDSAGSVLSKNLQELPGVTGKTVLSGILFFGGPFAQQEQLKPLCLAIGLLPWLVLMQRTQRNRSLAFMLCAYVFIVLIWPWPSFRFVVPIMPFLFALAFLPVWQIAKRSALTGALAMPFVAIVIATNFGATAQLMSFTRTANVPVIEVPRQGVEWASFEQLLTWVKTHTSENDHIAATYDSLVYLYTGRKCVRPYEVDIAVGFYGKKGNLIGTSEDLLARIRRYHIRYLLITPQPNYGEEAMVYHLVRRFEFEHSTQVHREFISQDGRFAAFKIDPTLLQEAPQYDERAALRLIYSGG